MFETLALVLTTAGGLLAVLPKLLSKKQPDASGGKAVGKHVFRITRAAPKDSPIPPPAQVADVSPTSNIVLATFAVIFLIFAAGSAWRYWEHVKTLGDTLFLAIGLLLIMVGGMFVQVLSSNYTNDRPLLKVTASQLLYPLLFSPVVFYPIWLIGNEQGAAAFSFYAAFLNGYFWQSVVASAKRPEEG